MLKQLGANAYLLELQSNIQFSPIFNVEDLVSHDEHDNIEHDLMISANLPPSIKAREVIKEILDDQVVSTH